MITTSPDRIEFSTKPRWVVYGFLFWAAFLLVLEPDNMIRAARAGHRLSLDHELLRITVAAAIGAAVTPAVLWTTIRFPILGTRTPVALSRIPVKSKGRLTYVDIANVDWIETQGNYLALHVGSRMHLIRDTLGRLEKRLDSDQFIRVHRRTIVALNRIQDIRAEGNGDATLRLLDGREVRVSRSYGKAVRDRWSGSV